jgi:hypothetical protein
VYSLSDTLLNFLDKGGIEMSIESFEVVRYDVFLAQSLEKSSQAGTIKSYASISCYGPNSERFHIRFLHPDSIPIENRYNPDIKVGTSYLPYSQYIWYIDLLRNEKPIFAILSENNPQWNSLTVQHEIREVEPVPLFVEVHDEALRHEEILGMDEIPERQMEDNNTG